MFHFSCLSSLWVVKDMHIKLIGNSKLPVGAIPWHPVQDEPCPHPMSDGMSSLTLPKWPFKDKLMARWMAINYKTCLLALLNYYMSLLLCLENTPQNANVLWVVLSQFATILHRDFANIISAFLHHHHTIIKNPAIKLHINMALLFHLPYCSGS